MSLKDELISIDPKCSWKELGGQVVILQADQSPPMTHELNSTGSFIWSFLAIGPKKFTEILQATHENFEADSANLEAELADLLNKLVDLKLVKIGH